MELKTTQMDRAVGVLLGAAAGDALGVPYEFGSCRLDPPARMLGGGLGDFAPGEWSDDTSMAVAVAEVAATGADLRTQEALDEIGRGFLRWYASGPPDVGIQTRGVLGAAAGDSAVAAALSRTARELHERTGRTAGNGSLMRTAPVALAHLGDTDAIDEAARAVSALTHYDPVAGEACVLWCLAIDHAVRTGELDVTVGLERVGTDWRRWLVDGDRPSAGTNGWVVLALLDAWSAVRDAGTLDDGLQRAVALGGDTDTVAAIAGGLLGARFGGSAVPARYRRVLHGWPGYRARDLVRLAALAVRGGRPDPQGWPTCDSLASYRGAETTVVPHPDDPGVLLGAVGALRPGVADAVVSLCRLGATQVPLDGVAPEDHVEVWLIDKDDANADLRGVLDDAASAVRELRAEGKTVFLHCVHAHTRTPVVAAVYGAAVAGGSEQEALARVQRVLPSAWHPRRSIVAALRD